MILQFTTAPWQVDATHSTVDDCTGRPIAYISAPHLCDEEKATILRAIASLSQIVHLLAWLKSSADEEMSKMDGIDWKPEAKQQLDLLQSIVAYIAPIEHSAEVAATRFLHATETGICPPEAMQNLTHCLRDSCNVNLYHYSQPVQDAFKNAMSLLNLEKGIPA